MPTFSSIIYIPPFVSYRPGIYLFSKFSSFNEIASVHTTLNICAKYYSSVFGLQDRMAK